MSQEMKNESEVYGPRQHPALRIVGICDSAPATTEDAAREHDRVLADAEEKSWSGKKD